MPENITGSTNLPIYILLHGVYGSAWAWALKGGVHTTARRLISQKAIQPAIIAMPSDGLWGDGSAYFAHHGKDFAQWILSDVPLAVKETIMEAGPLSPVCIGGLSMGGYGALRLGALHPQTFTAISTHSAITELNQMAHFVEENLAEYTDFAKVPNAIDALKKNHHSLPKIRFDCGISDPLIEPNRKLHRELAQLKIEHLYEEFPGGHEWAYWQTHVEKSLRFFDTACHP